MARTRNLGNLTDLLSANTTTGIVSANTAPAQFDNSSQLASTSFVQASLGNRSGYLVLNAATTLTAANAGMYVYCTATATYTLPNPATLTPGTSFYIQSSATTTATITTTGGVTINGPSGTGTTTMILQPAVACEFITSGTNWVAVGGSGSASLAASGYQKLPSGLIIQWGSTGAGSASSDATQTIPIAFPSIFLHVFITSNYTVGSGGIGYAAAQPVSLSTFTWRNSTTNSYRYLAVGY